LGRLFYSNMELVFATNNLHKLMEVQHLLGDHFKLLRLEDIGCTDEVPENQDTLEGNASEKAHFIYSKYRLDCFADDTGLEIEFLNGAPGVYSARYAGPSKDSHQNMQQVLLEMENASNRKARFRCVIALVLRSGEYQFEGIVNGVILKEPLGKLGFGYDPIFRPDGYDNTFAEMPLELKNQISHRALAVNKLVNFLKDYQKLRER
jgi:XTP/dITP diphosphohydrolase